MTVVPTAFQGRFLTSTGTGGGRRTISNGVVPKLGFYGRLVRR